MTGKIDPANLHQRWVHAHEEDTDTEMVYRPAAWDLPPARGRTGFELRPDQTAVHVAIGRADVPDEAHGSWDLEQEDDATTISIRLDSGETQTLSIVAAEKERLVVRK